MRSIRVFAKNMGDPYYEPTIVVHDIMNNNMNNSRKIHNFWNVSKFRLDHFYCYITIFLSSVFDNKPSEGYFMLESAF